MRRHKLLIPVFLGVVALIIGTSLIFSNFNSEDQNQDQAENAAGQEQMIPDEHEQEKSDMAETAEEEAEIEPDSAKADSEEAQISTRMEVASEAEAKQDDPNEQKAKVAEDKPEKTKPEPKPEPKQVKDNPMARVTADGLNVRPDPSTDNPRIGLLERGQTVEVLAGQNNWLQVKLSNGGTGWISGAYVSRLSPSNAGNSLSGRVIVIDPGHGGSDPGAVGRNGLQEKVIVLDVGLRVAEKLRAQGAKVVMTRDTDVFIPLAQRVSIAENAGAEIFVSIHANAHPDPGIGGTETYYYRNKATSTASANLATLSQSELVGALRLRDIGVKDANFLVIRQTSMPSVLLELGFLSNAHEESLMRTDEFRQNAADAIYRSIQGYLN